KVELQGIDVTETCDSYLIKVAAGEDWHQLVKYCVDNEINGLENLALIPGVVGAAPVQNIGAYGSEFKDVCESVEYIDLETGETNTLLAKQCEFAYRDSIFKTQAMQSALITSVTLKLKKAWQPHFRYGALQNLDPEQEITAKQIFESVCEIRSSKLPDPNTLGNAGSFFKNPVVEKPLAEQLLQQYPNMPTYPQAGGTIKLAAGWLIDQCQLKGKQIGGAAVHQQQALVLVNINNASAEDIVLLADFVRNTVKQKFNVDLQHEVRFIANQGETNLQRLITEKAGE
ncbi:MAG: UDP-N-acetylmuramate dehydrogenase, partial [Psychromonas sp.]|nr:UDP-N-acetylmuramate dehydrogenase [Psychromonas sp.]